MQPQDENLEQTLRSGQLTRGGFLGTDPRHIDEIIAADAAVLEKLGYSVDRVAKQMQTLRDIARPALGNWVKVGDTLQVKSDDYKGCIPCPWPHDEQFEKRITTARRLDTQQEISWTDMNIHLIRAHGFFEGKNAFFRIEPEELIRVIFY